MFVVGSIGGRRCFDPLTFVCVEKFPSILRPSSSNRECILKSMILWRDTAHDFSGVILPNWLILVNWLQLDLRRVSSEYFEISPVRRSIDVFSCFSRYNRNSGISSADLVLLGFRPGMRWSLISQ